MTDISGKAVKITTTTPGLIANGSGELDVKKKPSGGVLVDADGLYIDVAAGAVSDNTQYEMFMNGQVFG